MLFQILTPKQSLNKAFLKEKISRSTINHFKENYQLFLERTSANKNDEEHLKSQVTYFLLDTWFKETHQINPIGKNDLVIHTGKNTSDPIGVIIEVKSLTNKPEMISAERPNSKAFHELILYYLRQRIDERNNEIKHLIVTNIDEWYIFDANEFDKKIFRNSLIKKTYEIKKTDHKDNPWFYEQVKNILGEADGLKIEVVKFNLRDFEKIILNDDEKDDHKLISIFKILSPVHLLKLAYANDSNSLQPKFYAELLHLIGLGEVKDGSKKLIQRKSPAERHAGSLLENTITALDTHDKISRLNKPSMYGDNYQERVYNVALELVITWINRILFLKLLEAQLLSYHKNDKEYKFLNSERIKDFDDMDKLFFSVLAKKPVERRKEISALFEKVPYLNSSLFEPTELEHQTLFIYGLEDRVPMPILSSTVLKDANGRSIKGTLNTINYLFGFLDAYDFSSEGGEQIQEENKTLINAAVLGLIFEKINGYKDGSFFTPGFITMYMSRENIRGAVLEKFNTIKGWNCENYSELYDKIEDKKEANDIINGLKICDPAVGSGHFLVSALNEIIAIKHDLKILSDKNGKRLKEYQILVQNDELIITDEDGDPFTYNPKSLESQRVQETLFHEKQMIIENCLFGVDINPNSVKICRLRLWIELLKNAYYKNDEDLETLPNIDINIKTGNSLISRFKLSSDLKQALKSKAITIEEYKNAVSVYRNAKSKEQKWEMERLIATIKSNFRSEINKNSKELSDLNKLEKDFYIKYSGTQLFEHKLNKAQEKDKDSLNNKIVKLRDQIEEIKTNKIFENAFEWRFEFPEVLDDNGDFIGFDLVIGNPPYKLIQPNNTTLAEINHLKQSYEFADFKIDLYQIFFQLGGSILKDRGIMSFITPSTILNNVYAEGLRNSLNESFKIQRIAIAKEKVFEDAEVHTGIFQFHKIKKNADADVELTTDLLSVISGNQTYRHIKQSDFNKLPGKVWNMRIDETNIALIDKISKNTNLSELTNINRGLITGDRDKYFAATKNSANHVEILSGSDINRYYTNIPSEYVLFERPKSAGGCWDKAVHFAPFKICIRQIGMYPIATLIEDPFAVTGNVFTVTSGSLDLLKSVLAILNSKCIRYYWNLMFSDFKTAFPQVTIFSLKQIPIPSLDKEEWHEVRLLTDKILALKWEDISIDTTMLESKLDLLIYRLFELTTEEILVMENQLIR
ncbi:Eco57I restriction-modification methylase domain-containing protein [Pedobacter agri]|uniref:type IIG restriction enzyme/methyltransferase n=1 Tax=Pedobacter agri TaxID=454586 RepID=UPI00292D0D56|nr:TaqI-like C-terminal specificity domain-containing protein [Pedobacter agri]